MEVMLTGKDEILKHLVVPTFDGVQLTITDSVKNLRVCTGSSITSHINALVCLIPWVLSPVPDSRLAH